jgi:hypothetical protein
LPINSQQMVASSPNAVLMLDAVRAASLAVPSGPARMSATIDGARSATPSFRQ